MDTFVWLNFYFQTVTIFTCMIQLQNLCSARVAGHLAIDVYAYKTQKNLQTIY